MAAHGCQNSGEEDGSDNMPVQASSVLEEFAALRRTNETGYSLLFEIEVLLREFIAQALIETYGRKWTKQGLPADLQQKIRSGLEYERSIKWHKAVLHHPLYYVDFPDLKKIIISGNNWRAAFDAIFSHKTNVDAGLSEIEIIRNKVAHNRFLTTADLAVLSGTHAKIIASIPSTALHNAKIAATKRTSILEPLTLLKASLDVAFTTMMEGEPMNPTTLNPTEVIEEWWFNEDYLARDLSNIVRYVDLCRQYAKFIRGLGQANVRRAWVRENTIFQESNAAIENLREIIQIGETNSAE